MVLQALYGMDLMGRWDEGLHEPLYDQERWPSSAEHAGRMLRGILEHRKPIDEAVAGHADHWSLSRMNLIDRNLLRIATYELLFCEDVPLKVSINEAIEIGKLYGTAETKGFLNGILDKIARPQAAKKQDA